MKRGDKIEVTIGGHVVANAEVTELDDGTATLVIPKTQVVMGVRTSLDPNPARTPGSVEHQVIGTESTAPGGGVGGAGTVTDVAPTGAPSDAPVEAAPSEATPAAAPVDNSNAEVVVPAQGAAQPVEAAVEGSPEPVAAPVETQNNVDGTIPAQQNNEAQSG